MYFYTRAENQASTLELLSKINRKSAKLDQRLDLSRAREPQLVELFHPACVFGERSRRSSGSRTATSFDGFREGQFSYV